MTQPFLQLLLAVQGLRLVAVLTTWDEEEITHFKKYWPGRVGGITPRTAMVMTLCFGCMGAWVFWVGLRALQT